MSVHAKRRHLLKLGARTLAGAGLALGTDPVLALGRAEGAMGPLAGADAAFSPATRTVFDDSSDYRALVCVFLQGGMDGFSLLVPTGNAEYAAYKRSRGTLGLAKDRLQTLSTADGTRCGRGPAPRGEAAGIDVRRRTARLRRQRGQPDRADHARELRERQRRPARAALLARRSGSAVAAAAGKEPGSCRLGARSPPSSSVRRRRASG